MRGIMDTIGPFSTVMALGYPVGLGDDGGKE
jgi:hypothetical protein